MEEQEYIETRPSFRSNRIEILPNSIVNGVKIIKESQFIVENNKRVRMVLCECECGNEFTSRYSQVRSGKKSSCGCKKGSNHKYSFLNGNSHDSKTYNLWRGIKTRCFNRNRKDYADYGERGITMFNEWINNFEAFYLYVSKLPHFEEDGYTIDRIDNDGNYAPNNIRWATQSTQSANQRPSNKTGYIGIYIKGGSGRFYARLKHLNTIFLGECRDAIEDAIFDRNRYILDNNLEYPLNYITVWKKR